MSSGEEGKAEGDALAGPCATSVLSAASGAPPPRYGNAVRTAAATTTTANIPLMRNPPPPGPRARAFDPVPIWSRELRDQPRAPAKQVPPGHRNTPEARLGEGAAAAGTRPLGERFPSSGTYSG